MAISESVGRFFQGYGMRDVFRALKGVGIEPTGSLSLRSITSALAKADATKYFTPTERSQIASIFLESYRLTETYSADGFRRYPSQSNLTPIPNLFIQAPERNRFRYQILASYVQPNGQIIAQRSLNINTPRLLSSNELQSWIEQSIIALTSKYAFEKSVNDLSRDTEVNYQILSVLRQR